MPIISFRHAGLEDFYVHNRASGIRPEHRKRLARQLYVLDRMTALTDIPRSWNLHRLLGIRGRRRKGYLTECRHQEGYKDNRKKNGIHAASPFWLSNA